MASKNNIFYKLYSNDIRSYVDSGYICDNAGNEQGTTFIINDSAGQIVDSKGNPLASIDLSNVGAGGGAGNDAGSPTNGGGITEYTTNTKILQPHTAYLLQGTDFGLAYETTFYRIPKDLVAVDYFDIWSNVEFDVQYNAEFCAQSCHINTKTYREKNAKKNKEESFIDIINAVFCEIGLPIVASLENIEKEDKCGLGCDGDDSGFYLKFTSTSLGYAFNVRNFIVYPIYQDEDHPDSPFSLDRVRPQDVIDAISYVQPKLYKIVDFDSLPKEITDEDADEEDEEGSDEKGKGYFRMEEGGEDLYMFADKEGYDEEGEEPMFCWYNNHLFIEEAYNDSFLDGFYCNRIFTTDEYPTLESDLYFYNENHEYEIYNYATITKAYSTDYETDYWSEDTEIYHVIDKYHIHFKSADEMRTFRETIRSYHEAGEYEKEVDYIKDYIAREAYIANKPDDIVFEDLERWNMVEEIEEDAYNLDVYIKPLIEHEDDINVVPVYDDSSAYRVDCSLYLYILDNLRDGIKYVNNYKHKVYDYKATYCYGSSGSAYVTRSEYAMGHLIDAYSVVKRDVKCYPIIADESLKSWLEVEIGPGETVKLKKGLHAISWEDENGFDIDPDAWKDEHLRFIEPKEGVDYQSVYCHMNDDGTISVTLSLQANDEEGGCLDVMYDPKELVEVFKRISAETGVYDMDDDGHRMYFLLENVNLKLEPLKYPNGAMRGLIIAPQWPDGYIDVCKPLQINHIKDYVDEYAVDECECQTDEGYKPRENEECACSHRHEDALSKNLLYRRYHMRVLCAHQDIEEKRMCGLNLKCGKLITDMVSSSNDWSFEAQIAPYQKYEELTRSSDANDSWSDSDGQEEYYDNRFSTGSGHFCDTHDRCCDKNYMGMYGYLKWVENNHEWVKFKTFYGIIAGVDSLESNDRNLVRSVYVFNPNDIPVKCNYMIFS